MLKKITKKATFFTHNDKSIDCNGTHLQGSITATYAELKALFGKPHDGDGYKVDAEWEIEFADGTVATIYNWKDGKNYNGSSGLPKTKITDWHIGGNDKKAIQKLKELLRE
jgi:hypothetical protein